MFTRSGSRLKTLVFAEPSAAAAAPATTISATASTATTTETASPAAPKASAARLGPGFIHIEGACPQLIAVHGVDGLFRFLVVGHFHESESAGLSCVAVCHNRDFIDLPIRCKSLPKFFFTDVEI